MTEKYSDVLEMPEFVALDGTRAAVASRLINLPTGKADLQGGHRKWLQDEVIPIILARPNAWVDLFGYASKRGDTGFNLRLSQGRVNSVKTFLAQKLIQNQKPIEGMIKMNWGFGEDAPGYIAKESDNSAYWRAVEVIVFGSKPSIVRPIPKPLEQATLFEIRVVGGASTALFLQADNYVFQIVDLVRRQTAFYHYTGGGVGISIPKIPGPGSMTWAGSPTKFSTTKPVELYQFNSKASLYQDPGATLGSNSIGGTLRLSIREIRDFSGIVLTSPGIIPIEGGSGIQMPGLGSASEGVLALVGSVYPFNGY